MDFGSVIPTLQVASIPDSIAFYQDKLGFSTKWTWSEESGFGNDAPAFACIEHDDATIFLSETTGGRACFLFIELPFIDDIDALAAPIMERIHSAGPIDQAWGSREFSLTDPDGHNIRFSCPIDRHRGVA